MDIYKEGTRKNLTFNTPKGVLSMILIWTLGETDLVTCLENASALIKKDSDGNLDFLKTTKRVSSLDQLRFDILKDIYLTKKAEEEENLNKLEIKKQNQKVLAEMARRKEDSLTKVSDEELEKMLRPV